MKPLAIAAAAASLAAPAAFAANPVATSLSAGFTFVEYTGSAPVGIGAVDIDSTLFFIDEKAVAGVKSWFVFFDSAVFQNAKATIVFDAPITSVFTTAPQINATTPVYGDAGITYGSRPLMGLEGRDTVSFSGNTLVLDWSVADPGDHIRVLTSAVPEPTTQTLLAAGLLAAGLLARRRFGRA